MSVSRLSFAHMLLAALPSAVLLSCRTVCGLVVAGSILSGVVLFAGPASVKAEEDSSWAVDGIAKIKAARGDGGSSGNDDGGSSASSARAARLGGPDEDTPRPGGSLSGGISWQADAGCVPGQLRGVLSSIVSTFGPVTVTSTCRSVSQNRAAGGASGSYHLQGEAIDFRVHGAGVGAVYAYLSSNGSVGGLKHYGGGLFHIDTGPRRSF